MLLTAVVAVGGATPGRTITLNKSGALEALQYSSPRQYQDLQRIMAGLLQKANGDVPPWIQMKSNTWDLRYAATNKEKGQSLKDTARTDSVAADCIRELAKLVSAIEVGPSFNQYTDRLIDAKTNIDPKLHTISNSKAKFSIEAALEAFIDARELWRLSLVHMNSVQIYLIYARSLFQKYNVQLSRAPETVPVGATFVYGGFREFVDPPMRKIWTVAVEHIQTADQELTRSK